MEAARHYKEHLLSNSVSRQETNHVPEPIAPIAELMSAFRAPWALCGGWAIDAWLGRQTRDHDDVDLSVFADDQRVLFDHLAGWHLEAHDLKDTHQPWDGRHLDLPNHITARLRDDGATTPGRLETPAKHSLDIQLGDRSGDDWILSRRPRISLPLRNGIQASPWGLPTVVPEVLLFFKATAYFGIEEQMTGGRFQDEPDFLALLPHLTEEQRHWLREAISVVHPDHPWLSQLSP